jgi:predicted adenylyl cyclase CyaB
MKNIEIKYRITHFDRINNFLTTLPDVSLVNTIQQKDIYYRTVKGRLKLRIPSSGTAELIYYERENVSISRESNYYLFPVESPELLHQLLKQALGIQVSVDKERTLFQFLNVRIHLDRVAQLGEFLEFESVIDENFPADHATENLHQIQQLLDQFDMIPQEGSYADLLKEQS